MTNAVSFLKSFCRSKPYLIATINDSGYVGVGFDDEKKMGIYISLHAHTHNIYFSPNSLRGIPDSGKAKKTDIATLDYLHVDLDADIPEDCADVPKFIEDFKKESVEKLKEFKTPPTCIIDSGGGIQAFWRLKEPQLIHEHNIEVLESYNRQISMMFGGDKCHNIDRIMRVPFTKNIPNQKKKDQGRFVCDTKLIELNDNEYGLDQFIKAPVTAQANKVHDVEISGNLPDIEVHELGFSNPKYLEIIINGNCTEKPFPSRSEALMSAVAAMVKIGLTDDEIAAVCLNKQNGISKSIYEKTRPMQYLERQISKAKEYNIDPDLQKMNEEYCVVSESGKTWVFHEHYDHEMEREAITRQDFTSFKNYFCNQFVFTEIKDKDGKEKIMKTPLGKFWIEHENRRSYVGVVFSPNKEIEGMYNLWRGFAVEPIPNDWSMMKEHIKKVICADNDEYFEYLMNWMARSIQYPAVQGEVAVIIRGDKGTGKGTFVNGFGHLFGSHYLQITNSSHLVGKFNAHMQDVCLLFSDEGFWAGDKQGESVLKGLITEDYMMVERKGVDSQAKNNHISLIIASNNDWVVPATEGERRYFVLDATREYMQDLKYFDKLKKQLRNGGYEGMLYDLLERDISNFNIRMFPQTEALNEQKILSMDHNYKWWFDKLHSGLLLDIQEEWENAVPFQDLLEDYQTATSKRGVQRKSGLSELSKFLVKMCPSDIKKSRMSRGATRVQHYELPPLEECRKKFDQIMGTKTNWDEIEELSKSVI